MNPERIREEFPAPEFRGAQERALRDVRAAFEDGNDVVLVRAPTGSGKSLIARAVVGCARPAADADPTDAVGALGDTTDGVQQVERTQSSAGAPPGDSDGAIDDGEKRGDSDGKEQTVSGPMADVWNAE